MKKKELRNDIKNHLETLNKSAYDTYCKHIAQRFFMEESVKNASAIGITISTFPEVDTEGIIKTLWEMGKTVVVPKCSPKDRTMIFYKIESYNQLETVYMQLLEPNPLVTTPISSKEIDLLVVPGIVYNRKGYRIGYGGGYYDRFLMDYAGETISLAFNIQLNEAIKIESYDLPVNKIITNSQVIQCLQNRRKDE